MFGYEYFAKGCRLFIGVTHLMVLSASTSGNSNLILDTPLNCSRGNAIMSISTNGFLHECAFSSNSKRLDCIGTFDPITVEDFTILDTIKHLNLCGWRNNTFDPYTTVIFFPNVEHLVLSYSNLSSLTNKFPGLSHLQIIQIVHTKLSWLNGNLFAGLHSLKILDIRFNKLKYLESAHKFPRSLQTVYFSRNFWNCSLSLSWLAILEKRQILHDENLTVCSDQKYQGRSIEVVAYYKRVAEEECRTHPEIYNCSCTLHYIRKSEDGKSLTPINAVNCSNKNFHKFPSYLPRNTSIFYANNNKISDIKPLLENKRYRNVIDIYLDDNNICSIDILEAGYWLRHFRVFSLKRNLLHKLPVYAIDDALENNLNALNLQLSQNPWVCDCKFAMRFQEILMKYHVIIQDYSNISCSVINEDGETRETKLLSLQRSDVCRLPEDNHIYPLDLVNGILTMLILFVLIKLGYDYYQYKHYGHLPWIIRKLP